MCFLCSPPPLCPSHVFLASWSLLYIVHLFLRQNEIYATIREAFLSWYCRLVVDEPAVTFVNAPSFAEIRFDIAMNVSQGSCCYQYRYLVFLPFVETYPLIYICRLA